MTNNYPGSLLTARSAFGARVLEVTREALAGGPMGDLIRGDEYRDFVRCGEPLARAMENGGDIGAIRTSCGVFAGAVLHHAGLRRTKRPRWGGALLGNWLQLTPAHPSWLTFSHAQKSLYEPEPGDVFFVGDLSGANGHVGILISSEPGLYKGAPCVAWYTAEGGGGDGTLCSFRAEPRALTSDRFSFDRRGLTGFWSSRIIGESL